MPAYPSFYSGQMQMNQPNMYPGFNQQMQNPYMDRMNQLQQYQQSLQMQPTQISGASQMQAQVPGIIGRVVNDFGEITANDVPMDGRSAVFPKADMSEIQVRAWSADGKIVPVTFVPLIESNPSNSSPSETKAEIGLSEELIGAFMGRFDDIAGRIERLEKSIAAPTGKQNNFRGKKDGEKNE